MGKNDYQPWTSPPPKLFPTYDRVRRLVFDAYTGTILATDLEIREAVSRYGEMVLCQPKFQTVAVNLTGDAVAEPRKYRPVPTPSRGEHVEHTEKGIQEHIRNGNDCSECWGWLKRNGGRPTPRRVKLHPIWGFHIGAAIAYVLVKLLVG